MSTADTILFWLNLVLSLAAIPAMLWGLALASRPMRVLRLITACLAGFYAAGYVWVLIIRDPVEWSALFRRAAPLSFAIVWIAGPVMATLERKRMVREAARFGQATEVSTDDG